MTTQPGDANRIASKAVANGSHWIIACGGDGTIHEVVNAIAEKPDVVLGVLPCGRGNDFAEALKIPTKPAEAMQSKPCKAIPLRVYNGTQANRKAKLQAAGRPSVPLG